MEHKLTFLDGAMGTMLQRHGLKLGEIPELLGITQPDLLTNIHRQYIEAGTEIVYANTFGANRRKMQKTPYTVADVVSAAISAAKKACIGTSARVALDIGPLGELLEPMGTLPFETALDMFAEIVDAGAQILDVNVGYPGVDEVAMLPRVVKKLQEAVDVPLQLDSTNAAALEAALRVYNGKAAVNSVNGEEKVLQTLLPVVKKYGAAVVGLALDEKGLPKTAAERVEIAKRIVDAAESFGIPREDVFIDCLTLTVSAQQDQAEETLAAVRTVHRDMGLQTVLGVSNISFGLPNRLLMTQTFLVRAMNEGLTLPIINPNQKEIMDAVAAFRVLSGEDEACAAYVERFGSEAALAAEKQRAAAVSSAPTVKAAAVTNLDDAIIRGLKADAARLAKEALATENELSLVEKHLIPALDKVGTDYERGVAFLPQLLGAAQAAQAVFSVIRDSLAAKGGEPVKKGRIVIATVKGDIHDIGKNIVRTVLENYGYDVLDLGRDVPPETVVDAVVKENIRLVGLSALMTTTLPSMEETVRQLHTLPNPPSIMVGGAVVTPEYAQNMGAFYAKDARASVEIAKKILG